MKISNEKEMIQLAKGDIESFIVNLYEEENHIFINGTDRSIGELCFRPCMLCGNNDVYDVVQPIEMFTKDDQSAYMFMLIDDDSWPIYGIAYVVNDEFHTFLPNTGNAYNVASKTAFGSEYENPEFTGEELDPINDPDFSERFKPDLKKMIDEFWKWISEK